MFRWNRISFNADGEVPDNFQLAPDWTIEILSPEQKSNKVIGNILHCLRYGCRLGWFIDPDDHSVLIFLPRQELELLQGNERLLVLEEIELEVTVNQVFGWLKIAD